MATPLPPQGSDASRPRQHDSWGEESCLAGEQHPLAQARGSCFDGKQLKSEFLEIYKDSYGYPGVPGLDFDAFCCAEFPQLQGRVYLDYAGAAPVSQSQLKAAFSALSSTLFTNPHTHADLSLSTSTGEAIADLRLQVLALLNANPQEYCCIFTSGATAGMLTIAHAFPWQQGSQFAYTLENHNSVLGIRESALASGASATAVEVDEGYGSESRVTIARDCEHSSRSASASDCDTSRGASASYRDSSRSASASDCDNSHSPCASDSDSSRGASASDTSSEEKSASGHACTEDGTRGDGINHECSCVGALTVRGHICAADGSPQPWQNEGQHHLQHPQRQPEQHREGQGQGQGQGQQQQQQQQLEQHRQAQGQGQQQEELRQREGQQGAGEREQAQALQGGKCEQAGRAVPCLFAMPAECNFSGRKLDLSLVARIQTGAQQVPRACLRCTPSAPLAGPEGDDGEGSAQDSACARDREGSGDSPHNDSGWPQGGGGRALERWFVLLDAAKACSTSPPDLSRCPADFVTLSFYKMCGFPSGLGALVAKKEALRCLRKRYFGGGTVSASAAESAYFQPKGSLEEWFEDGTPPFLDIVASLPPGLALLNRLGFPAISRHSLSLASFTAQQLAATRHTNGNPVCQLYSKYPSITPASPRASSSRAKVHPCDASRPPPPCEACSCSADSTSADAWGAHSGNAHSCVSAQTHPDCNSSHTSSAALCLSGRCQGALGPKRCAVGEAKRIPQLTKSPCEGPRHGPTVTVREGAHEKSQQGATVALCEGAQQGCTVTHCEQQGPTVTFNLRRADGSYVGHREVAKLAELHSIVLRTGSFCNPGASTKYLGVSMEDRLALAEEGGTCWDDHDLREGRPMGAVRASFGYASSLDDALALLRFVHDCFVERPSVGSTLLEGAHCSEDLSTPLAGTRRTEDGSEEVFYDCLELEEPCDFRKTPGMTQPPELSADCQESGNLKGTPGRAQAREGPGNCQEESCDSKVTAGRAQPWEHSGKGSCQEEQPGVFQRSPQDENTQESSGQEEDACVSNRAPKGRVGASIGTQLGGRIAFAPCPLQQREEDKEQEPQLFSTALAPYPLLSSASLPSRFAHSHPDSLAQQQAPAVQGPPFGSELPLPELPPSSPGHAAGRRAVRIDSLYLYPIKSCGAMEVTRWPLGANGLLYDREWALVDAAGTPLRSRRHPGMYLLRPFIDLAANTLTVTSPSMEAPLVVTLEPGLESKEGQGPSQQAVPGQGQRQQTGLGQGQGRQPGQGLAQACPAIGQGPGGGEGEGDAGSGGGGGCEPMVHQEGLTLCGDRVAGLRYACEEVSAWLSRALGVPCSLVRQVSGARCMRRPGARASPGPPRAPHREGHHPIPSSTVRNTTLQQLSPHNTLQKQASTNTLLHQAREGPTGQQGPLDSGLDLTAPLAPSHSGKEGRLRSEDKPPLDPLGFANEGQFLVVSQASVQDLNDRLLQSHTRALNETQESLGREQRGEEGSKGVGEREGERGSKEGKEREGEQGPVYVGNGEAGTGPLRVCALRFRPNLVVSGPGLRPFEEEGWKSLRVQPQGMPTVHQGEASLGPSWGRATNLAKADGCEGEGSGVRPRGMALVSRGGCSRCAMVNLDPNTGASSGLEPLRTLAQYRREKSKIMFGVLFGRDAASSHGSVAEASLGVGDVLEIEE